MAKSSKTIKNAQRTSIVLKKYSRIRLIRYLKELKIRDELDELTNTNVNGQKVGKNQER